MKSGSNAWAWMKRAASNCLVERPWLIVTPKCLVASPRRTAALGALLAKVTTVMKGVRKAARTVVVVAAIEGVIAVAVKMAVGGVKVLAGKAAVVVAAA